MSNTYTKRKDRQIIAYRPRSKVRLTEGEMMLLKKYVEFDPSAYTVIKKNTSISRDTVLRVIDRCWMELQTATKLRDFIKSIRTSNEFKHLNKV